MQIHYYPAQQPLKIRLSVLRKVLFGGMIYFNVPDKEVADYAASLKPKKSGKVVAAAPTTETKDLA